MAKHTDITRDALARIHGWRTTVVFGAALLVICFQRPLGIGAEGIAMLQWLVCASFLLDLPITRFYFPRPRFPRSTPKGKSSTGCRRPPCACSRCEDSEWVR
ncbi:MAG TPA: hypothetical protein VF883_02280 [Thermoanaerobaculia bacterium]|jgi:hypothetical protein